MAGPTAVTLRREERVRRRQAQILDAARACVRADGFHAASMSRICAEASMSVGHVYKYFATKEAIMIALVERDFEDFMSHVTRLRSVGKPDVEVVINEFLNDILWFLDYDRAALSLETLAESARNPSPEARGPRTLLRGARPYPVDPLGRTFVPERYLVERSINRSDLSPAETTPRSVTRPAGGVLSRP